jgi:hypothetical protein
LEKQWEVVSMHEYRFFACLDNHAYTHPVRVIVTRNRERHTKSP